MHRGPWWEAPILESVAAALHKSEHVRTDLDAIERAAAWMAFEEFRFPSGSILGPFDLGTDPAQIIDAGLFTGALNFAFTDFDTGEKFEVEYMGDRWSDSEAMFARVHEAVTAGLPILSGEWMATASRRDVASLFRGSIELPMLDERVIILNDVGRVLVEKFGGSFHRFVRGCAPAMYAGGEGLLERLVDEFPRFNDVSVLGGLHVQIYKLAQLVLWLLHIGLSRSGELSIADLDRMTAFADYIVPVALRAMGILEYTPALASDIEAGTLLAPGSPEEVEIRVHTLFATAALTDAINRIRPSDRQLIVPEVDYRLWSTYHATFAPHHLTRTVMY
ncbi:MAG: queuosine salvage family protein [Acidimicrobiia bacterium]|nr:queuosine salvage family protein [Acidimicrobiia bacterium]